MRRKNYTIHDPAPPYVPTSIVLLAFRPSRRSAGPRHCRKHRPQSFLSTPGNPVQPVDEDIKPITVGTWPYDQVFRTEETKDEVPDEFVKRFSPEEAESKVAEFSPTSGLLHLSYFFI